MTQTFAWQTPFRVVLTAGDRKIIAGRIIILHDVVKRKFFSSKFDNRPAFMSRKRNAVERPVCEVVCQSTSPRSLRFASFPAFMGFFGAAHASRVLVAWKRGGRMGKTLERARFASAFSFYLPHGFVLLPCFSAPPMKKDDDLFSETSMSFGDHLEELRKCLFAAIFWWTPPAQGWFFCWRFRGQNHHGSRQQIVGKILCAAIHPAF